MIGAPPNLQDAIKDYHSDWALPTCGIFSLLRLARDGHGDYTWGFRIYRTTYSQPDSDAKFSEAIEILDDYIRNECFSYVDDGRHSGNAVNPPMDGKANEQLWKCLRHEIVEDRELLEDASPAKILTLAQDWVHSERKATTRDSPRYRFFLYVDDEVIANLLQLPMPPTKRKSVPTVYSVKVLDARFTSSPPEFSGGEDSDSEASEDDQADDGFEGWFWASANYLAYMWFCEHHSDEELLSVDTSWDGTERFVLSKAALNYGLPLLGGRRLPEQPMPPRPLEQS